MQVDYLIIGGGLCGTWLSYYLHKAGKSFLFINDANASSASCVASGLINPITGRRVVTTWMADELLPFAWNAYTEFGKILNAQIIQQKNILAFPSAPDLLQAFYKRMQEDNGYINKPSIQKEQLLTYLNFPFDVMEISPCYLVDVRTLINNWLAYLKSNHTLYNSFFNEDELILNEDYISYKNITARKIIYCNGIQSSTSKYWKNMPFIQNKGQALIVDIPDLNKDYTYKFGSISFTTWHNDLWWVGSSNELNFDNTAPTEAFYKNTTHALKSILKIGFEVKEHLSSVRPSAVERRPFAGVHTLYNQVAILNGMGSKGCSLAPWFANELSEHLINNKPINPLADIQRYANLLKRE